MRKRQWVALSVAVLSTAIVGGCSADGEAQAAQNGASQASAAAQQPSPSTSPTDTLLDDAALDDAAICVAFGDVMTIVENADLGLADGRMATQERDGWYKLATRVLGRLPAAGDSAVRTAIRELQGVAPVVPVGAYVEQTGVGTSEWKGAQANLGTACEDLDAPLAISVFTGG